MPQQCPPDTGRRACEHLPRSTASSLRGFFVHVGDPFLSVFPWQSGALRRFGGKLAEFLEAFPPAASLAELSESRTLKCAWYEAFHAPLSTELARMPKANCSAERLLLRPGARLQCTDYLAAKT